MENDTRDSHDKERTLNFALLIQQIYSAKGIQSHIESQNQGIPDSEIILIVEAWLETVKEKFKKPIKDGMTYGNKG